MENHYQHNREDENTYYRRQARSQHHTDELLCIIYDGMHKEKTNPRRLSQNPSNDSLECLVTCWESNAITKVT